MTSLEIREIKAQEAREREKYTTEVTVSHSREKIQLCYEIIQDHFGNVAAVSQSPTFDSYIQSMYAQGSVFFESF